MLVAEVVLMTGAIDRFKTILFAADLKFARAALAWASLLWCLMLLWPGDTFQRPTYELMGKYAPEWVWATSFGIHGIYSLINLSRDKIRQTVDWVVEGMLGCVLWTSSCFFMLFSVYPPPAAISAEIVSAFTSWVILARYPIPGRGDV